MRKKHFHEDYFRKTEEKKSTERNFGIVMAMACALIGFLRFYRSGQGTLWFIAAVLFVLLAYFYEKALSPLNLLWQRLGQLLFYITNPIILAVIFMVLLLPLGLIFRLLGKDPLHLKKQKGQKSYWLKRNPPGPIPQTMKNQF
ncbi:MAG: hypothetical protein HY787_23595 [Deltaproteobacteria bacterium]|nr:hypothetical protein [Deltaproteobacteria bacterium]